MALLEGTEPFNLLVRARHQVQALYGDFFRHPLERKRPGMLRVARDQ